MPNFEKDMDLEALQRVGVVLRCPFTFDVLEPVAGDTREIALGGFARGPLLGLAKCRRVRVPRRTSRALGWSVLLLLSILLCISYPIPLFHLSIS